MSAKPVILTVTPNPTIDRAIFCRDFRLGTVVRAEREVLTPCGKGINAAMAIHELGGETVALGLKAGRTGELHSCLLDDLGIRHDFVEALGENRTLVVLIDLSVNEQSSISAQTLQASPEHLLWLLARLDDHATGAWGVIFGGSLPPGLPLDSYAQLVRRGRQRGLVTLLDSSGEPLLQGVRAIPDILKINRDELAALDPEAPSDLIDLARRLVERLGDWAAEAVIVTLAEQGSVLVTVEGAFHAIPPQIPVLNTAGAGDALGGGIMLARSRGADWPAALVLGTAAAASVTMNTGTGVCRRDQVGALHDKVGIVRLDIG